LNLAGCIKVKDVSKLGNVNNLNITFCKIKNISMLKNTKIITDKFNYMFTEEH
jgi:hypothetical protein